MFSYLIILYQWVLKRLPRPFSIPLVILLAVYFIFVFPLLAVRVVPKAEQMISRKVPNISIPRPAFLEIPADYSIVGGLVSALLIIATAAVGILVSYGLASLLYSIIRGQPMKRLSLHDPSPLPASANGATPPNPLDQY